MGSEPGDVPAGDVEPGEAGEEGHDERDPTRSGAGRGRGRLLGAAVLAPHGAGQRLHGGGREEISGAGLSVSFFLLLVLTCLLPLMATIEGCGLWATGSRP